MKPKYTTEELRRRIDAAIASYRRWLKGKGGLQRQEAVEEILALFTAQQQEIQQELDRYKAKYGELK